MAFNMARFDNKVELHCGYATGLSLPQQYREVDEVS